MLNITLWRARRARVASSHASLFSASGHSQAETSRSRRGVDAGGGGGGARGGGGGGPPPPPGPGPPPPPSFGQEGARGATFWDKMSAPYYRAADYCTKTPKGRQPTMQRPSCPLSRRRPCPEGANCGPSERSGSRPWVGR
jgi:hypothetical protein